MSSDSIKVNYFVDISLYETSVVIYLLNISLSSLPIGFMFVTGNKQIFLDLMLFSKVGKHLGDTCGGEQQSIRNLG